MSVNAPIDIVNIALVQIGSRPATSLTENRSHVQYTNARYEGVRDFVLASGNWNSAQKRVVLQPLSTTPAFGFSSQFQLPGDFIRFVRFLRNDEDDGLDMRFRIEGRMVLSDESTMNMIYIHRLTEVALMDELLKNAIGTRLAFEISLAAKADIQQTQALKQLYDDQVSLANLIDANQAPVDTFAGSLWNNSRIQFPYGGYRPIESS